MSDQTTSNTPPAEAPLCKTGCGFFGSTATGLCSKCWNEQAKKHARKEENTAIDSSSPMELEPSELVKPVSPIAECKPIESSQNEVEKEVSPNVVTPKPIKKKKKKKQSYKAMMASMTKRADETDIQKEKENLKKVTGGGSFSKIDRI